MCGGSPGYTHTGGFANMRQKYYRICMIFPLFRTKEQKDALSGVEMFCIDAYGENGRIDTDAVRKKLDNLGFEPSRGERIKLFTNFVGNFDGDRLPDDCIGHFNKLADALSVRGDGKVRDTLADLKQTVERERRMREIRGAKKLPTVPVDVILKKGEEAYFDTEVTFCEERTKRVYQGGSAGTSIRVARGVSFRVGSNKGNAVSEEYLKEIDTGEFIITNKRIVFVGVNKSWNIPMAKLMRVQDVFIEMNPALSFSSETASKKKFAVFNDADEALEAKAIIQRVTRGEGDPEETEEDGDDGGDILIAGDEGMEDEVLD